MTIIWHNLNKGYLIALLFLSHDTLVSQTPWLQIILITIDKFKQVLNNKR